MTGTYANANLASEPGVLKYIYEAYIGYKLMKTADLWIDAGVIPSHIGFESAVGQDCRTLTRSIVEENTPFYESGIKLGYTTKSKKWYIAGLLINGWQRMQRPNGYTQLAAGTQVTYTPDARVSINHSTFYGNMGPDSLNQFCFYQDFYAILKLSKKWEFIVGFDYGLEQDPASNSRWSKWWSPVLIAYYHPSAISGIGLRAEYFHDPDDILISIKSPDGLQVLGYSVNYDRYLYRNVLWRIEGKVFNSVDAVFTRHSGSLTDVSPVITTSLSVAF